MRYKAVIFDLDGTLLNTLDDLADATNHTLSVLGYPLRTRDEVRSFIGNGVHKLLERSMPHGVSDEVHERAYSEFGVFYKEHCRDNTAPYEGISKLLKTLNERGFKLAIVSNKVDFAVKQLCAEFFDGLMQAAVGDSDKTRTKPAPDMVMAALNELGVSADESVYVGDTDVDIETAKNAGMDCISVSWGYRTRAELESYGTKNIADTADDILRFI